MNDFFSASLASATNARLPSANLKKSIQCNIMLDKVARGGDKLCQLKVRLRQDSTLQGA